MTFYDGKSSPDKEQAQQCGRVKLIHFSLVLSCSSSNCTSMTIRWSLTPTQDKV